MTITTVTSLFKRMKGLLGRCSLNAGEGLHIKPCSSIHTIGMRFAIDAVFLDRRGCVVRVVRNIPSGKWWISGGWHAYSVVEFSACSLETENLHLGESFLVG